MSNITILGNGFDLALGLHTKYADFVNSKFWPIKELDFLRAGESNLYNFLYNHVKEHKDTLGQIRWIDLEALLYDYATNIQSDILRTPKGQEIVKYDKEVYSTLKEAFKKYLIDVVTKEITLDCKKNFLVGKLFLALAENNTFNKVYSYNYTRTAEILSFLYDWKPQVIHLHASIEDCFPEIILGIGENKDIPKEYRFLVKSYSPAFRSYTLSDDLAKADEIIIFGLSLGSTDFIYFKKFFIETIAGYKIGQRRKRIHIITYDEDACNHIRDSFIDAGIHMRELYERIDLQFYQTSEYGNSRAVSDQFSSLIKSLKRT